MPAVAAVCDYVMDGINVKKLYYYSNSDSFDYTNCTLPNFKVYCVFRAWDGQVVETRWKMYYITFLYITHTSKGTQPQRFTAENTVNRRYGGVLTLRLWRCVNRNSVVL